MNIGNVKGNGGIERGSERIVRLQPQRVAGQPAAHRDEAAISAAGQRSAAAVEGLVNRARQEPSDRADLVAAAKVRLDQGEHGIEALREIAKAVLDAGFLAG